MTLHEFFEDIAKLPEADTDAIDRSAMCCVEQQSVEDWFVEKFDNAWLDNLCRLRRMQNHE